MKEGIKEILFSEEEISIRTKELAKIIDEDYKGKDLLLVGVLKGSVVFISELLKRLHNPCEIDFMAISTYGKESKSSGVVKNSWKKMDAKFRKAGKNFKRQRRRSAMKM